MQTGSIIDEIYQWIKGKIKPYWKVAFVSGMIIGVLAYGYLMSNHFLTFDSMWNQYSKQDMITSGRQFLTYACTISSYYDLPWLNGLLAIFYLSITAVLVVEVLGIRNRINVILATGMIVVFPSVISTFCFTYTVDGYMLACLLSAAAFLLTDRKKWGWCGGFVLLGISLGIYQSFISFTIILCILRLLLDLLEQIELRKIIGKMWRYMVMGLGGYVFYVATLRFMLAIRGLELSGYQGTDQIVNFSLSNLLEGLESAFKNFGRFLIYEKVITVTTAMKIAVGILIFLGVTIYILLLVKNSKKQWMNYLLAGILALAIPFGESAVNIISPNTFSHTLLRGSWSLLFVFVIAVTERIRKAELVESAFVIKAKKMAVSMIAISTVVLIFEFSVMANIVGFNMHSRYEKTYALCLRIVDRLEMTDGYEHGMKIALMGGGMNPEIYPTTDFAARDLAGYWGAIGDYSVNSTDYFASFIYHYMNITTMYITDEEEHALTQTREYIEMPCFPAEESIKLIDDVWVIKLNG